MSNGFQYTVAYTFAKAIDWWAGTIPQPEYQYLNKGDQANSNPHLLNTSVIYQLPFGSGREVPEQLRRGFAHRRRVAGERVLLRPIGDAVHGDRQQRVAERRHGHEPDGRSGKGRGRDQRLLNGGAYFDVTAFKPVTEVRFGTAAYNTLRGPAVANLDPSLFRTFAIKRNMNLQIRIEALNATNTPHFANPASNVANLQLNPDGSVM